MLWRPGQVQAVERVEDAFEADERVLDHLARLGSDPAQPRECRHYLYVPGELQAQAVAGVLTGEGWDAEEEAAPESWLVTATTHTALTRARVRATRAQLERLACDQGGAYDGWEVAAD
jgi:hypothetical protein